MELHFRSIAIPTTNEVSRLRHNGVMHPFTRVRRRFRNQEVYIQPLDLPPASTPARCFRTRTGITRGAANRPASRRRGGGLSPLKRQDLVAFPAEQDISRFLKVHPNRRSLAPRRGENLSRPPIGGSAVAVAAMGTAVLSPTFVHYPRTIILRSTRATRASCCGSRSLRGGVRVSCRGHVVAAGSDRSGGIQVFTTAAGAIRLERSSASRRRWWWKSVARRTSSSSVCRIARAGGTPLPQSKD